MIQKQRKVIILEVQVTKAWCECWTEDVQKKAADESSPCLYVELRPKCPGN
jgi:hypothetical protein